MSAIKAPQTPSRHPTRECLPAAFGNDFPTVRSISPAWESPDLRAKAEIDEELDGFAERHQPSTFTFKNHVCTTLLSSLRDSSLFLSYNLFFSIFFSLNGVDIVIISFCISLNYSMDNRLFVPRRISGLPIGKWPIWINSWVVSKSRPGCRNMTICPSIFWAFRSATRVMGSCAVQMSLLWFPCPSVGWLIDWMDYWSVQCLIDWLNDWMDYWSLQCLIDWLIDWLIDISFCIVTNIPRLLFFRFDPRKRDASQRLGHIFRVPVRSHRADRLWRLRRGLSPVLSNFRRRWLRIPLGSFENWVVFRRFSRSNGNETAMFTPWSVPSPDSGAVSIMWVFLEATMGEGGGVPTDSPRNPVELFFFLFHIRNSPIRSSSVGWTRRSITPRSRAMQTLWSVCSPGKKVRRPFRKIP